MYMSLNLGTINISDTDVASFVKNKSADEIKSIFVSFLKAQVKSSKSNQSLDSKLKNLKIVNPEKQKRVKDAFDSLNKKLKSIKNIDILEEKENYLEDRLSL